MVTQRRYSVTGQTPPDDAEAMKARSPKLQPLDTSGQPQSCLMCDSVVELSANNEESGEGQQQRGRKMGPTGTTVRTSSKRSATQLPSPNSPSHQLPPKIARYEELNGHVVMDTDTDTETDSDVTDVVGDSSECEEDHGSESQATSFPSTPEYTQQCNLSNIPDAASLEGLQLYAEERTDDEDMGDYALSPAHSRNPSPSRQDLDEKKRMQADWAAYHAEQFHMVPESIHIENIEDPRVETFQLLPANVLDDTHEPLTFLTLPPEIRHQIYRNCENLVIEKPLVYCISTFHGEMQHPLASVSRLVRSEALAIFYSYNLWVIKVEFRMMYEAFQDWIIRLGDGAGFLRLVNFAVRGSLFKPKKSHSQSVVLHGHLVQLAPGVIGPVGGGVREELYCPPDGDASFKIDLSEKYAGGKVQIVRNDGTKEAGEKARIYLGNMVEGLWEKRRNGTLNGQDWISMVDDFITFIGGW